MTTARSLPPGREAFRVFRPITTRWSDNDVYGHINNVRYYSFFDTAVNGHLIEAGALDIHAGRVIGLVVETRCSYFAPLAFPEPIEAGIRVDRLGRSSVTYGLGIFRAGAAEAAAAGAFTHVHVDRATRRPVDLPHRLREVLAALRPDPGA
ncbi:MAG: thioesterase family protein [Thermohalobaculum sp.]|nr:thioesterase family protein [Thermohalobaculum sp.]